MANNNNKNASGLGLAAALAATAAGLYYLYGKNGDKHRKQVKGWMLRAKGEVLERMEKLDEITEGAYHKIVDDVTKQYNKYKDVDKGELANIALELKQAWANIRNLSKKPNVKKTSEGSSASASKTKKPASRKTTKK